MGGDKMMEGTVVKMFLGWVMIRVFLSTHCLYNFYNNSR